MIRAVIASVLVAVVLIGLFYAVSLISPDFALWLSMLSTGLVILAISLYVGYWIVGGVE